VKIAEGMQMYDGRMCTYRQIMHPLVVRALLRRIAIDVDIVSNVINNVTNQQ
jgi:hypothetical protein